MLESVPPGVTTFTVPVVARVGTAVVSSVLGTTLKEAVLPSKVMTVAPVGSIP